MTLQRLNGAGSPLPSPPTTTSSKSSTRIPRLTSNMVALRYEDAVQAAPPIMVTTAKRCKSNSSASSISSASNISHASHASTASSVHSALSTSTRSSSDSSHYTSRIGRSRSSRSCAPCSSASSPSSSTRGSRIPQSPTLASSLPASPTSPRSSLVIPRASSLAAPPVEQHPALRGAASAACRPIVEETAEVVESPVSAGSPTRCRSTSYKRPSVSHMKQMIPLETVALNLPVQAQALRQPQSLPAPPGPPPQRPPPPIPTCASSRQPVARTKRPASPVAVASLVMSADAPAVPSMNMPPIIPMPSFTPAPAPTPKKAEKAEKTKEKTWRLPKALTFRSHRKKTAASASAGQFLPADTAFANNGPSGGRVEPNPPYAPILASPLTHSSSYKYAHAPKTNTNTDTASTTDALFSRTASRPFSSSSFAFSLSSVSTAHTATTANTATTASTATTAVPVASPSRPTAEPAKPDSSVSPPSSHFFFRVLSMSDSLRQKKADDDGTANDGAPTAPATATALDESPLTINTAIPTERLIEDDLLASLTFSKRGSLMFGGKRAAHVSSAMASFDAPASVPAITDSQRRLAPAVERESFQVRSLYATSTDSGARGLDWEDGRPPSIAVVSPPASTSTPAVNSSSPMASSTTNPTTPTTPTTPDAHLSSLSIATDHLHPTADVPDPSRLSIVSTTSIATTSTGIALSGTESSLSLATPQPTSNPASPRRPVTPSATTTSVASSSSAKDPFELAGGIEDWEDVDVADVDRYGFIRKPRPLTAASSNGMSNDAYDDASIDVPGTGVTRPGTGLSSSSFGRHFSRHTHLAPSRKSTARSMYTSRSASTTATAAAAARSSLRAAANQLPHNKDRKWIDEAGGMLAMEPGLGDIAEDEDAERLAELAKRKEWERAEKWRRMATVVVRGGAADADADGGGAAAIPDGSGMDFTFDLQHPKLIERTWKGIPDRWRAPAWYSFLASSAQHRRAQRVPPLPPLPPMPPLPGGGRASGKDKAPAVDATPPKPDGGETEEQIIAAFYRLLETASPDDVQIDLDVPRTVNGHVMFRRRYRGGQRLLFRVLHALSLYFPETGYVQGMAALGATLLCYYDEERCFVMLVRLFHLRGLERLYEPGFGGLMEALGEFEQAWLARNSPRLAHKLAELNIDATTYATRWYLTLFNLSVPFPAQLRIWDVFMLLGDSTMPVGPSSGASSGASTRKRPSTAGPATTRPATARPATADAKAQPRPGSAAHGAYVSATALITASAPKPLASKANLDILHAASTALIDGLQEVLLDADFENAMKAVTSWVPIKDENLLMKVVHAEWKRHQRMK